MIITRQRKRRLNLGRYLFPLLAIAVIGFLLGFPPTQHVIADGPLRPLWLAGTSAGSVLARPLSFAGQQAAISERDREIRDLNVRLETERQARAAADARVQQLQQQVTDAGNAPSDTPSPVLAHAKPAAASGAFGAAAAVNPADQRLAATWSAMEPEKAAALVQRLPEDEVVRVLAQMDADGAGAIMNALPPGVAARISRAVAQVQPSPNR